MDNLGREMSHTSQCDPQFRRVTGLQPFPDEMSRVRSLQSLGILKYFDAAYSICVSWLILNTFKNFLIELIECISHIPRSTNKGTVTL